MLELLEQGLRLRLGRATVERRWVFPWISAAMTLPLICWAKVPSDGPANAHLTLRPLVGSLSRERLRAEGGTDGTSLCVQLSSTC